MPAESLRNCGHASEPFALASGINRMPLDLATPAQNLGQRPTLARSAHRGRTGNDVALADKVSYPTMFPATFCVGGRVLNNYRSWQSSVAPTTLGFSLDKGNTAESISWLASVCSAIEDQFF